MRRYCFRFMSLVAGLALLGAILVAAGPGAVAQDQGATATKDVIVARKVLMDTLSDHMDSIEGMISAGKVDVAEAQKHADTVSVMLMAFPHLFPPASNEWKAGAQRDPALDTFASPDLWKQFADFYAKAQAASKLAYNASRADTEADLKKEVAGLRAACNGCHAAFLKTD